MVFRENIWDTDEMKAEYDKSKPQMVALFDTSYGKPLNAIVVLADELTAFAKHWLDLQGENKYKDAIRKIAARIETYYDTGYPGNLSNLVEIIEVIVGDCLQDVVKREPELLPCPVCESENTDINKYSLDEYEPICNDCGIRLMTYPTRERATEAWDTLPRKEKGVTQHEYDLRKANPYDLNDVAKLTRKEK